MLNPIESQNFYPPTPQQRVAARAALGFEPGRTKVMFVGRLRPLKGIDLLLECYSPAYDIVFCGGSSQHYIDRIRLAKMHYLPGRAHKDMLTLYHAADIVILPSRHEACNTMAVNEAQSCGLPVIVGRYEGSQIYENPMLQNVSLCDFTPASIIATIKHVIAQGAMPAQSQAALSQVFPTDRQWVEKIVCLMHPLAS